MIAFVAGFFVGAVVAGAFVGVCVDEAWRYRCRGLFPREWS